MYEKKLAYISGELFCLDKDHTSYVMGLGKISPCNGAKSEQRILALISPYRQVGIFNNYGYAEPDCISDAFDDVSHTDSENIALCLSGFGERTSKIEGELYSLDSEKRKYKIALCDIGEDGKKTTGGRFMVALTHPYRQVYCFNEYHSTDNYIKEKFPGMDDDDAAVVEEFMRKKFEKVFGNRIYKPTRIVKKDGNVFEMTRE